MSPAVELQSPNHWTAREFPDIDFKTPIINITNILKDLKEK